MTNLCVLNVVTLCTVCDDNKLPRRSPQVEKCAAWTTCNKRH